jgi:hypothetical protein
VQALVAELKQLDTEEQEQQRRSNRLQVARVRAAVWSSCSWKFCRRGAAEKK